VSVPAGGCDAPILVVGAGPVGLALANLLGRDDVPCVLLDKHLSPPAQSRAIGLTPPTLRVFRRIGIAQRVIGAGVRITTARVFDDAGEAGALHFDGLPGDFPFILTLPQSDTVRFLRDALTDRASVTFVPGAELTALAQTETRVAVQFAKDGKAGERLSAAWLAGCDGRYSAVRDAAGFARSHKQYAPAFVMADYADPTDWGPEARLFFTQHGSLEAFPLPRQRRRWVALLPPGGTDDPGGFLAEQVGRLAHVELLGVAVEGPSTFRPERLLTRTFVRGRVVLAGDAAHVMSPIGGQGMNTGMGDADRLAALLAGLHRGALRPGVLRSYNRERQRAFRIACRRNAAGMWLGTRTGPRVSGTRGWILRRTLRRPGTAHRLALHFAMVDPRFTLRCDGRLASPAQKRALNVRLFSAIAREYPWMTRILSLGRDAVWKRHLVRDLPAADRPVCVDLACGNGDLAALLLDRYPAARLTALDITPAMVERAGERLEPRGVRCAQRDMMHTELADACADIVTVGYGLRNAPDLRGAVAEIARILRPGGCLGVLEFSRHDAAWAAAVELALLRCWGGLWGWLRTRNADTYGYIAASLAAFPRRRTFHALLREYGFEVRSARRGFFGFVEVLTAVKRGGGD